MKKLFLEWIYNPKNFFANDIIAENEKYNLKISNGKIIIELKKYDPQIAHKNFNNCVESYFISKTIKDRIIYEIKEGASIFEDENGKRSKSIKPEVIQFIKTLPLKKSIVTLKLDKEGNVIEDTEEKEKREMQEFLLKIQNALNKDKIVSHLIESYKNSIRFPNDELVYLYEIIDAIQTYFNGKSKALKALNITQAEWSDLGQICNSMPLKQSRHRGQMIGKLIDSKNEIERARNISQKFIRSFINYLS